MFFASIIIELLAVLVSHAVSGIYSSELKYSKKITFAIWGIWHALQASLWLFGELMIHDMGMKFLLIFVSAFISQYIIFFATTKGKLSQRLFTILTYSVLFCMFMGFNTAIQGTFPRMHVVIRLIVLIALLAGILYYFLKCVCPLCRAASKSITSGWNQLVAVNVIFVITIVATSIFPTKIVSVYAPEFVPFLFLSISIFAVYPIIFSSITNMAEVAIKKEIEQQNKLLVMQIENENLQMAQERRIRHDIRHHNLVLLEFAKNNDIESVKEYLKNLTENDADTFGETGYCKNTTINTVLSVYEKHATAEGIKVKISANASRTIPIPPQNTVIVIANLFENAINATKKLKAQEKIIDIDIREKEGRLLVKIENPCRPGLKFDESCYGIGINSVITVTGKHEGMFDFSVKDGKFISKICLNF